MINLMLKELVISETKILFFLRKYNDQGAAQPQDSLTQLCNMLLTPKDHYLVGTWNNNVLQLLALLSLKESRRVKVLPVSGNIYHKASS